jgi:GntR family transcriptional regulator / MocR family aminotransferase
MTDALSAHFPGAEVSGISAGLHIIARLPARFGPQDDFPRRAASAGIALRPLSDCTAGGARDSTVCLVLGYAHLAPAVVEHGVRLLAEAVRHGRAQQAPPVEAQGRKGIGA